MDWPDFTAIAFTVCEVGCLKDPSIEANSLKSFMKSDTVYFNVILLYFFYDFIHLTTTNTFNTGWHYNALSTHTPTKKLMLY